MKPRVVRKFRNGCPARRDERGITMLIVALAMVAIIGMAALSIDIITLYLAREEAQRSADAAALTAARVISMSGITGAATTDTDPTYWQAICGGSTGTATQAAQAVLNQNAVAGSVLTNATITYAAGNGSTMSSNADCSALPDAFGVNPVVTVQVQQTGLPTFFSRIWRRTTNTVSATASAEVFNPSNSGNMGNQASGTIIPVQPRCVKPLMVPNMDPLNPSGCTSGSSCQPFVSTSDGHIMNAGITQGGSGVVGEEFLLIPDCRGGVSSSCSLRPNLGNGIQANHSSGGTVPATPPNNLEYLPGQAINSSVAVPSGASGSLYEQAVAGCDQTTVYYCGVPSSAPVGNGPNMVDLSENPRDDTANGIAALINEGNVNSNSQPTGQDYFNVSASPYGKPSVYPFQILSGSSNPTGLAAGAAITSSRSIISLPIFDQTGNTFTSNLPNPRAVTIVGFLQVFVNAVDQYGNLDVVVLNVAGCSNGGGQPVGSAVSGTSPVPVRLITPP